MLLIRGIPLDGPFEGYELIAQDGTVLMTGPLPMDEAAVEVACRAYWKQQGIEEE